MIAAIVSTVFTVAVIGILFLAVIGSTTIEKEYRAKKYEQRGR